MPSTVYFPLSAATDTEFAKAMADVKTLKTNGFAVTDVQRVFVKKAGASFVEAAEADPGAVPAGKITLD